MTSLHVEAETGKPWSARAGFAGEAVEFFASMICEFYKANGGENYVEMRLANPKDPAEQYVVTVRKLLGKTPHELRVEAESKLTAERARLAARVEGIKATWNESGTAHGALNEVLALLREGA